MKTGTLIAFVTAGLPPAAMTAALKANEVQDDTCLGKLNCQDQTLASELDLDQQGRILILFTCVCTVLSKPV